MPDHKYIKRERVNGKYRYWYEEPGASGKLPKKEPVKPDEPVLSTKKLDAKNPVRAYKTEDGRTVYAPAKNTKSIANKTISEVKKELDAKKSEPYVSDEYKQELEYNSKKNSFTNEKPDDKKITESTKKKVEPASPQVSDEYKQELEYNSKKNSFTNDSTPAEARQWLEDHWAKQAAEADKKFREGLSDVDKFLGEEKQYDLNKAKRAKDDAEWEYESATREYDMTVDYWNEKSAAWRKEFRENGYDRSKVDPELDAQVDFAQEWHDSTKRRVDEAAYALSEAKKALKEAEKEYAKTPMGIADKVSDLADKAADTIEDGADAVKDMFKRLKRKFG